MKKFKAAKKAKRQLIQHLVNSFGERQHKMAYQSIVGNITGLTRKVQSLHHLLKNAGNHIDKLETENVALKRDLLLGDVSAPCGLSIGNVQVYGDQLAISVVQSIMMQYEDAAKSASQWKEAATKAMEEAEESATLAKHWRRVAEEAQQSLSSFTAKPVKLPKIKHPAQFDYADEVIECLKSHNIEVQE